MKPYRIIVGQECLQTPPEIDVAFIPKPDGRKAIVLEVGAGACHFGSADELRSFIKDLQRAGQEAFKCLVS